MEGSPRRRMASMSVWLGITSILFYSTGVIAIILGGIAIILAFLSRGNTKKLSRQAIIGLIIGTIGVTVTYVTIGLIFYKILSDPSVVSAIREYAQTGSIDAYNNMENAIYSIVR
ncbi:hypothetical protein [Butyrivibrio fibrisolvens]|uniref:DUF4190 domain-containing protein n=2 Tax=Butyrivibrio fibrisolvens TaxID=831 RepID=A0A1H9KZ25_BUTFI|nr:MULTISPECIES: hypothetical protein [Butyrivibrio]MCR4636379.1 hypothetical protein [Butyrivibrio sp.]SER04013.1 hypothetical protein SAMN04487884_101208 [Butyrivibrio fibrisolvens]